MNRSLPAWLYVLFLALVATATDEFVIAGVLPAVAADLNVTVAAAGQLVTVFAVTYAFGAPTLAVVFDRLPRRTVMVGALAVFVLANAGAAMSPGYWPLMTARVVAALAAALVTSAAFTTAASGAPEGRQGRYLAVVVAGMTAALFTGVPVGALLGGAYGWRAAFWLIAGLGALATVGLVATAPRVAGSAPAPLGERLRPLRDGAVLRLVAVTFLAGSGGLMFYSYLSTYVGAVVSDSYSLLTLVLFVVGVAGMAGALLAGRFTDTWGPRRTLRVVLGGHAASLASAAALIWSGVGAPVVLGLVVALWSVFAWGLTPPIQGSIMSAAGPRAGMTALALNISGLYLGTGVAGALGGIVVNLAGIEFVPVAGASLMLLSLVLTPGPGTAVAESTGSEEFDVEHA